MGPQAKGCRQLGKRGSGPCPGSSGGADSPAATVWTSDFQNCTIIFFFFFLKPVDAFFVTAAGESSYALSRVATHNLQTTC